MLRRPGHAVQVRWRPLLVLVSLLAITGIVLNDFVFNAHDNGHDEHEGPMSLKSQRELIHDHAAFGHGGLLQPGSDKQQQQQQQLQQNQPKQDGDGLSAIDLKEQERRQQELMQLIASVEDKTLDAKNRLADILQQLDEKHQQKLDLADSVAALRKELQARQGVLEKAKQRLQKQQGGQKVIQRIDAFVSQHLGGGAKFNDDSNNNNNNNNKPDVKQAAEQLRRGARQHSAAAARGNGESKSNGNAALSPEEEQKLEKESMKKNAFNEYRSSKLSLHRDIPDTRHANCRHRDYPPSLPPATVIICFVNEVCHCQEECMHVCV